MLSLLPRGGDGRTQHLEPLVLDDRVDVDARSRAVHTLHRERVAHEVAVRTQHLEPLVLDDRVDVDAHAVHTLHRELAAHEVAVRTQHLVPLAIEVLLVDVLVGSGALRHPAVSKSRSSAFLLQKLRQSIRRLFVQQKLESYWQWTH